MTDSPDHLLKECDEVLQSKSKDVYKEWLKELKPGEGALLRQERMRSAIVASVHLVEKYLHSPERKRLLMTVIHYYKFVRKKLLNYIYAIKFFSERDYECHYIMNMLMAPEVDDRTGELYLKTRRTIINGVLNPKKKDELSGVVASLEEWFTIVSHVYTTVNAKQLLEKFTQVVKNHYSEIKKDQNIDLNGAEVLNIVDKLSSQYPDAFPKDIKRPTAATEPRADDLVRTQQHREQKIQGLLENRHNKMIKEMTDEVEELRGDLMREQQRVKKMSQRDKYFVNFIKKAKEDFLELTELILDKRLDPPVLDRLLRRFEEFETNIERKESVEMVRVNNRRSELKLIEQIEAQDHRKSAE